MIVLLQFEPTDEAEFTAQVDVALRTLAARPGFAGGSAGRSIDDPRSWVLVTEWDTVGSYRRALGNYDVKLSATPLLAQALDRPSAFEQLRSVAADGTIHAVASDRAAQALPPLGPPGRSAVADYPG